MTQAAVLQTARMAYSKALQAALPSQLEQAQASETLQFNDLPPSEWSIDYFSVDPEGED